MDFKKIIYKLRARLFPTGRAFRIPTGSWREAFYKGLIISQNKAYIDALDTLNTILPDNDSFNDADALLWEIRLGIFGNESSSLIERKDAILRKMNHPGVSKARQHYLYIQGQLQAAGFDVYVYENIFGAAKETKNPIGVVGAQFSAIHSTLLQHGQTQHGRTQVNVIANSIYQEVDDCFVWSKIFTQNVKTHSTTSLLGTFQHTPTSEQFTDSDFRNLFYICGPTLGDYVDIPKEREIEFRSLVLSLKPVQNVAVLTINYV